MSSTISVLEKFRTLATRYISKAKKNKMDHSPIECSNNQYFIIITKRCDIVLSEKRNKSFISSRNKLET